MKSDKKAQFLKISPKKAWFCEIRQKKHNFAKSDNKRTILQNLTKTRFCNIRRKCTILQNQTKKHDSAKSDKKAWICEIRQQSTILLNQTKSMNLRNQTTKHDSAKSDPKKAQFNYIRQKIMILQNQTKKARFCEGEFVCNCHCPLNLSLPSYCANTLLFCWRVFTLTQVPHLLGACVFMLPFWLYAVSAKVRKKDWEPTSYILIKIA